MEFKGIKRAALEIAYDNGGINIYRSERKMVGELERFLAKQPIEILPAIDSWLAGLSNEELSNVCCGEHTEMQAAMAFAPPFTDQLLNDYFEQVC